MAVSKLTIIAELRDDLTKGLKGIKRTINDVKNASSQASVAADLQSDAFKRLARQYGWTADAYGSWHEANGRFVSKSKLAAATARAQANAFKLAGQDGRRAAAGVEAFTWKLMGGRTGAIAAAGAVGKLATSLGFGGRAASGFSVRFADAMTKLPASAGRAAAGFERNMARIRAAADKTNSYVGKKMKNAAGNGYARTAAAVGGGAFMALGTQRIQALQETDVRLDVMGMEEGERQNIVDTVNKNVLGTQFGLGEAAKVGSQLLGAGIEQDEFDQRMKDTVNVASLYGNGDIAEMGLVLSQVTAKGKLTGEEALQLNERSMPVYKWIAEQKGVGKEEVQKMIENGEVSADDFWQAMSSQVAGGAAKMGETPKGMFNNMKAAIGRGGEAFMRPMMDELGTIMKMITNAFNAGIPIFTRFGEAAAAGLDQVIELLPLMGQYFSILAPSLSRFFESLAKFLPQLIEGFVGWSMVMLPVSMALLNIASVLLDLVGPLLPVLIPLLGAALVGFKAFAIAGTVATGLTKFGGVVKWLFTPLHGLFKVFGSLFKVAGGFRGILSALGAVMRFSPVGAFVTIIWAAVTAFNWLYDNVSLVRDAVDGLTDSIKNAVEWFTNLIGKADEWFNKEVLGKDEEKYEGMPGPLSNLASRLTGGIVGKDHLTWVKEQRGENPYDVGIGWWDQAANKDRERLGIGEYWGTGEGFFSRLYGKEANTEEEADIPSVSPPPAHADGGWTSAGAHLATVGERGREFIMTATAAQAIESAQPGALAAANATGTLPAGGGVTVHANVNINGAQDPVAIGDQVEAALRRLARDASRTYDTPTERGAK